MIKWFLTKGFSLLDMNREGTCLMNASKFGHVETVCRMLANGSSMDEDTAKINSCEEILKGNNLFDKVVSKFEIRTIIDK